MAREISRREALKDIGLGIAGLVGGGTLATLVSGCDQGPRRLGPEEIIAVEPHHATRVFIEYKDKNGQIYRDTIHQSNEFRCGDIVIDPHDYLSLYGGSMAYGPFDSEKYQEYKAKHTER